MRSTETGTCLELSHGNGKKGDGSCAQCPGGNGRGILLVDRLPEEGAAATAAGLLCRWVAAVGRAGVGGLNDAKHGCLLQVLPTAACCRCSPRLPAAGLLPTAACCRLTPRCV